MREYMTTGPVNVNGGYIGLDEKQAKARASRLKKVEDGVFDVVKPVMFKPGECIKLASPDKIQLANLDEIKKAKKK